MAFLTGVVLYRLEHLDLVCILDPGFVGWIGGNKQAL